MIILLLTSFYPQRFLHVECVQQTSEFRIVAMFVIVNIKEILHLKTNIFDLRILHAATMHLLLTSRCHISERHSTARSYRTFNSVVLVSLASQPYSYEIKKKFESDGVHTSQSFPSLADGVVYSSWNVQMKLNLVRRVATLLIGPTFPT